MARFPEVYWPEVLRHPLDKPAAECEWITRYLDTNKYWHEEIKKIFGTPYSDGSGTSLQLLGARPWYRTVLMGGGPRPLREFADWDAEHRRLAAE
ncbi:hypothetical protein [Streptomyces sp. NBC_01236]|uniref:hypothetical protein n=1 Tax=Streptomyces sp. NBC_01236 TaxID=2903789 RepID=UPI002E12E7B2|nr:hypothetical protein OG324_50190 [Streptomyces sp. NBC_01236]